MIVQKWSWAFKQAKPQDLVEGSYFEFVDLIWPVKLKSFLIDLPAAVSNPNDHTDDSKGKLAKKQKRNNEEKSE